jgi:hypothetical protein
LCVCVHSFENMADEQQQLKKEEERALTWINSQEYLPCKLPPLLQQSRAPRLKRHKTASYPPPPPPNGP